MSTISEIDIRDWEQVDFSLLEKAKENANEFEYPGACGYLFQFVRQIEILRDKQIKEATKNVAALFKPKEV